MTRSDIDPDHIIKQNHLGSIVDNYSDVPGVIESLINSPEYDIMAQSCQSYLKENHDQLKLTKRLKNKLAHLKG